MNITTRRARSPRALLASAVALLSFSLGATAQEPVIVTGDELVGHDDWHSELTLYAWGKSVDGTSNGSEIDLDFWDDVLDLLEGAFMIAYEGGQGRLLTFAAYEYNKISANGNVGGTINVPISDRPGAPTVPADVNARAEVTDTQHMFEAGAGYIVVDGDNFDLALHGGVRYYDFGVGLKFRRVTVTLPPPIGDRDLDNRKLTSDDQWWQPFVGARFSSDLGKRWRLRGRADYGYWGGSKYDNNETWMAELMLDWRFNEWGAVTLGYRYAEVDYDNGSTSSPFTYDMTEEGPLLGLIIHF
jgi:hypothetical protein